MRQLRWIVHLVNDHFEHDGQFVKDESWIEYGLQRGWALLTKDQKIRYRAEELLSLAEHGKMFCLSSGNLTIEQQSRIFEEARVHIERAVRRHEARFYQVYEGGRIVKKWP
ncbi:MAG: hypothetical protein ACRDRX_25225 [Pseudonocardiaceae bacterium]